jgi:hypothetical protein
MLVVRPPAPDLATRVEAFWSVRGDGRVGTSFHELFPDHGATCSGRMEARIPLSFHVTKRLLRWSWFTESMRRKAVRDPGAAAARSVQDPAVPNGSGTGPLGRAPEPSLRHAARAGMA